jgi:peptidoglycan hydrolase-like amidase
MKLVFGILFIVFLTHIAWADIAMQKFGVGSYVLNPDDSSKVISIDAYIAGVVYKEIGEFATGSPENLKAAFIAQAVAARSNLAYENRHNSRDGSDSVEMASIPPAGQAYEVPVGNIVNYINQAVTASLASNILTLNGARIFGSCQVLAVNFAMA